MTQQRNVWATNPIRMMTIEMLLIILGLALMFAGGFLAGQGYEIWRRND